MIRFILFLCLFFSQVVKAQLLHTVYFRFGKSQPEKTELEKLDKWLAEIDPVEIDSIALIGYADSVGKIENNLKLSLKRAQYVHKHITGTYPFVGLVKTLAKGEKNKKIEDKDRRVLVKVWISQQKTLEIPDTIDRSENMLKKCYLVDYELLQKCFVSYRKMKKGEFALLYLETADFSSKSKIKYYYITYDSGVKVLHPVKWMTKTSGKKWYEKKRVEALLPASSFKNNKIVYYEKLSCDSCFKDTLAATKYYNGVCHGPDFFLNKNIRLRLIFLNFRKIRVKAPALFVDSSITYLDGNTLQTLVWTSKRRKPEFKYSKLDFTGFRTNGIFRKLPCCGFRGCGGFGCLSPYNKCFFIETGYNRLKRENLPYLGLGFRGYINNSELEFLGFVNNKGFVNYKFDPGLRLKFSSHIADFPLFVLSPFHSWHTAESLNGQLNYFVLRLYAGTEFRKGFIYKYSEQDVFIGISNARYSKISYFIQYGAGYRFQGLYEQKINRLFQAGLKYNLWNR